jgi:hypothetical protein
MAGGCKQACIDNWGRATAFQGWAPSNRFITFPKFGQPDSLGAGKLGRVQTLWWLSVGPVARSVEPQSQCYIPEICHFIPPIRHRRKSSAHTGPEDSNPWVFAERPVPSVFHLVFALYQDTPVVLRDRRTILPCQKPQQLFGSS